VIQLNLTVPEDLKEKLRKPYGKIFHSFEKIKIFGKLITVGDAVSYGAIKNGLSPDIIVFDFLEKRRPVSENIRQTLGEFKGKDIFVRNPHGNITSELYDAVRKSLETEGKVKILVSGEEDLAVLPFILESRTNTVILYGLRDRGMVRVKVNKKLKDECRKLVDSMKGS
jgi:GTP-dependent dephospho-CoA kinase